MKPTYVEPVLFAALAGEVAVVEWRPPKPGILNGCTSGARVELQAFDGHPVMEVDGKLVPGFITVLCDDTWVLSIPSMVVGPQTLVRVRFVSHAIQQDAIEHLYGEDTSAIDWLRMARARATNERPSA
jgi:hypothetical protein